MAISSLTISILAPRSATADLESALSFYDSLTCKSCSKPLPWFAWQGEIVVRMQGFWVQRLFYRALHPNFSPESRYRCATKQRDEGSWAKAGNRLALVGTNQSMGSRFSEDCRHPHDCAKGVDGFRWVRAWQNLTRILPAPSAIPYCAHVLMYPLEIDNCPLLGGHCCQSGQEAG